MANQDVLDLILLCQHDIPDEEAFCSLDHAAEIPSEWGDPFLVCARKERAFDSPLAFHAYETEPAVSILAVSVGGERHVII